MADKVWFITGSSSGFGRLLTEELLNEGYLVVATARTPESLSDLVKRFPDRLLTISLDVTNASQCEEAVKLALDTLGRIDVLVNNAGFGVYGSIEEVPITDFQAQFETNVFGVLKVLKAALPSMRSRRCGTILNISSIAGWMSFPGSGAYGASKFALEGLSESLEAELKPLGIRTILIEPGSFETGFYGHNYRRIANLIDDYAETAGKTLEHFDQFPGKQPGDPRKAVRAMIEIAEHPNPPSRLLLGSDAFDRAIANLDSVRENFLEWEAVSRKVDKS
jgi:NAD(P)-dependent dehydrogenase (short-subunit alcohol dehydrogenase family)